MRDRAWRRHIKEYKIVKRLKYISNISRYRRGFRGVNGNLLLNPVYIDYLGTKDYFLSKTLSTPKWSTKIKVKYSPNKSREYFRDNKAVETREFRRREFLKILKQHGLK